MNYPIALLVPLALTLPAGAVTIRGYAADPSRYERFTGFPAAPAMNPDFIYDAARYTGLGWFSQDTRRQCALVSPRHFVCATHWLPDPGNIIRFVAADGSLVQRTVASYAVIDGTSGGATDLCLATLDAPVPDTVSPFPYLNLGAEPNYFGKPLVVFGLTMKAGSATLLNFANQTIGNQGPTRMMTFNYFKVAGGIDDCHLEFGDSGSPTFALEGGVPALVGTHSTIDVTDVSVLSYDAFVPNYVDRLDALLEPTGHRMRPALFTPAELALGAAAPVSGLRQGDAGGIVVTLENPGSQATGNAAATLTFPAGQEPADVTAPDCVVERLGTGTWSVRKAFLAAGEAVGISVAWPALPGVAAIVPDIAAGSDTAEPVALQPVFALIPTFAGWAGGLEQADPDDDPDGDGLDNLLEYAFGGDPESGAMLLPGGHPLLPVPTGSGGMFELSYPERSDAGVRGLSYIVETSADLDGLAGATGLPAGAVSSAEAFDPEVPGFVKRTIRWPADGERRFARVKVELAE